jgi:hypothetical protein
LIIVRKSCDRQVGQPWTLRFSYDKLSFATPRTATSFQQQDRPQCNTK